MTAHDPSAKRKQGGRVFPQPGPKPKLPEPASGCSTPELASGPHRLAKEVLRRLDPRRKGGGDDPPEAA